MPSLLPLIRCMTASRRRCIHQEGCEIAYDGLKLFRCIVEICDEGGPLALLQGIFQQMPM